MLVVSRKQYGPGVFGLNPIFLRTRTRQQVWKSEYLWMLLNPSSKCVCMSMLCAFNVSLHYCFIERRLSGKAFTLMRTSFPHLAPLLYPPSSFIWHQHFCWWACHAEGHRVTHLHTLCNSNEVICLGFLSCGARVWFCNFTEEQPVFLLNILNILFD